MPFESMSFGGLGLGALAFRSTVTSVEAVEGQNLPSQSVTRCVEKVSGGWNCRKSVRQGKLRHTLRCYWKL